MFSVTTRTRRRIEAAERIFIAKHPRLAGLACRYDIIAVAGWRIRHIPGAWRKEDR